jgi:hypothetical protein
MSIDRRARLSIVPCSVQDAKTIIGRWHRHHKPPVGGLFALGVVDESGTLRGVAVVGRPVARMADDGNACSALYGAAWKAARALGWRGMVTYTLPSEGGASLRGAGWRNAGDAGGGDGWLSRAGRALANVEVKTRWEVGEPGPAGPHPTRGLADPVDPTVPLFAWKEAQ